MAIIARMNKNKNKYVSSLVQCRAKHESTRVEYLSTHKALVLQALNTAYQKLKSRCPKPCCVPIARHRLVARQMVFSSKRVLGI